MKLSEMTLTSFSDLLASDAPAPGGGSTAALEGALGVALTGMVAGLTVGKKKYAEHEDLMREIAAEAEKLRKQFVDIIDRDTEAFNAVSAVFEMPKDTDEQKAARAGAMQEALKACTLTPYEMMVCSLAALELTERALGKFNTSAASDLGVAAVSLRAAVLGAWLNVLINIGGIKDQEFANKYRTEGEAILEKSLSIAEHIYKTIRDSL